MIIDIKKINNKAKSPEKNGIGYDIFSNEKVVVPVLGTKVIPTDIIFIFPSEYIHYTVNGRKDFLAKGVFPIGSFINDEHGLNIIVTNTSKANIIINKGVSIAQLIFTQYIDIDAFSETTNNE